MNAFPRDSPQLVHLTLPRLLLPYIANIGSPAFRRRVVEMLPSKDLQRMVEITDTLHERSVHIYNLKKDALEKGDEALKHQIGEGRDIMSILCEYPSVYAHIHVRLRVPSTSMSRGPGGIGIELWQGEITI